MFRLHRNKSDNNKSGERIDFKFSSFQALQVPKEWDKLFVSVISMESGKTIAKSSKASTRNGTCHWKESISESVWISQEDSPKETEEHLFKIVVAMGSARSGILGEAVINLTNYMSSRKSVLVTLPLKRCLHGTVLQVKIHCLNPRTTVRDEQWQQQSPHSEGKSEDYEDIDNKSDVSDTAYVRSIGSTSGKTSHPGELGSRNTSFSASGSRHSSDSLEGLDRTMFSPRNNSGGDLYSPLVRQELPSSQNGTPYSASGENLPRSNVSSFNSKFTGSGTNLHQNSSHLFSPSGVRNGASSRNLLEEAEDTIEELRSDAKMWERNARKVMSDLESLRKEFTEYSRRYADLDMELSAASSERDGLKQELELLRNVIEESKVKQKCSDNSNFDSEGMNYIQKELEEEIKFQKESNTNLTINLKKSQDSNMELVLILQELEETIEKHRLEIDNFSDEKACLIELQKSQKDLQDTVSFLEKKLKEENKELMLERDRSNQVLQEIEAEWTSKISEKEDELINIEAKLSSSLEVKFETGVGNNLVRETEALKERVQVLEDKNKELLLERNRSNQVLLEAEAEWKCKISDKDEEDVNLEAKLSSSRELDFEHGGDNNFIEENEALKERVQVLEDENKKLLLERNRNNQVMLEKEAEWTSKISKKEKEHVNVEANLSTLHELKFENGGDYNLIRENETLREKVQELEKDCDELTKENLNLIYKLKELNGGPSLRSSSNELWESEIESLKSQICQLEQRLENEFCNERDSGKGQLVDLQKKYTDLNVLLLSSQVEVRERETEISSLKQLLETGYGRKTEYSDIEEMETELSSKTEELEKLKRSQLELEAQVCAFQKEKDQLNESFNIVSKESYITSKCLDDVRNELMVLTSSLDAHISANKMLERKSSELESGKEELELHLSEMEEENIQLSERISGLEAQLRYLTDEKETYKLQLDNSNSTAKNLSKDIEGLEYELETQRSELQQKLQEMQSRWSETQEEYEYLKKANLKLQATVDTLIEECSSVQKLNGELRKQKLELHERCTQLEFELRDSRDSFSNICQKADILEAKLSSMEKDIALKENFLTSEIDSLCQENVKQKEKLVAGESLLNQLHLEKSLEVEHLQKEVAHLSEQITATYDEREISASNAVLEISSLHADKVKLENALQDAQAKVQLFQTELHNIQLESGNLENLTTELSASKHNEDLLVADLKKLQRLLDDVKANEERFKVTFSGLELKLTASEYERTQLSEEISDLKIQLQKVVQQQEEVLVFKNSLNESKNEKGKLESSLQSLSEECDALRAERVSFIEKLSNMQESLAELEDSKRVRLSLEEKLLRLNGDLTVKDALHAQDAELKNELNRITRANSQFQRKIQCLEEEKDECLKRVKALERELSKEKLHLNSSSSKDLPRLGSDIQEDAIPSESRMENYNYEENGNRSMSIKSTQESDNEHHDLCKNQALENDLKLKIDTLEIELAEAVEANNMYKLQLKGFLTEGNGCHAPKRSISEGVVDRSAASLEAELKDIKERYFDMSLRFAEVEAQREELVMKVKNLKPVGKGWFS